MIKEGYVDSTDLEVEFDYIGIQVYPTLDSLLDDCPCVVHGIDNPKNYTCRPLKVRIEVIEDET